MKIALDAGHGGRDPGCSGNGLVEKEVSLDLARRLGHLLRAEGLQTRLTREGDVAVSVRERARSARAGGAEALVSLHVDWSPNADAHGFTAYVAESDERSEALAESILESAEKATGRLTASNGVRPDTRAHVGRLWILRRCGPEMPSVLLECGFLSNRRDASLLTDPRFRQDLCIGITRALVAWFRRDVTRMERRTA